MGKFQKMTLQTCVPEISAHVDRGLSGGSRVRRPGSEDPHRHERKFCVIFIPGGRFHARERHFRSQLMFKQLLALNEFSFIPDGRLVIVILLMVRQNMDACILLYIRLYQRTTQFLPHSAYLRIFYDQGLRD
jgi:hypothetical protein